MSMPGEGHTPEDVKFCRERVHTIRDSLEKAVLTDMSLAADVEMQLERAVASYIYVTTQARRSE